MNKNLLSILINKNVIRIGTEIGMVRNGVSIDGRAVATNKILVSSGNENCKISNANHIIEIFNIDVDGDEILLYGHSTVDGHHFKVSHTDIHVIDGMTPEAVARVYGLFEDGTPRRLGKKRGRKSKQERLLINDQDNRLSSDASCCA